MSWEAWGDGDEFRDDWPEKATEAGWIDPVDQTKALIDVMNERARQQDDEGFAPEHDDAYQAGDLAQAAATYALHATGRWGSRALTWPWAASWWKPSTPRRDLVKAAALLLAEIERLDRAAARAEGAA